MTTTNMHEAASSHKGCDGGASRENPAWDFLDRAQVGDVPALACLYGREGSLSPEAWLVGARLAGSAQPLSGEAIVSWSKIADDCDLDYERILWAMDELQSQGVVTFWSLISNDNHIYCEFEIESDLYYGDDTNPPSDQYGDGGVLTDGLDWCYDRHVDEVVERVRKDPNPKRHRIFSKTKYCCFYCITERAEQIDHMHPRIRGGGNEDANLIGACQPCNVRKKDRTVEEYRAYLAHRNRLPDISHVRFWGEAAN